MSDNKINIYSDTLTNANNLRGTNIQKRQLKEVITDILKSISRELNDAYKDGKKFIITSMPITYSITNMSNAYSQRFVWAAVIEELIKKEYRIWIYPTADKCKIKITWLSNDDEYDIKNQLDIIIKNTHKF